MRSDPGDVAYLQQAIGLAVDNAAAGRLPFGAVVVRAGEVLATGVNTEMRDSDPTAHAEVAAIRNACAAVGATRLPGATVYSSCEPCAVCQAVSAAAELTCIVYAAPREAVPDLGNSGSSEIGALLTRMQDDLRSLAPDRVTQVPVDGAAEPFERFLAERSGTP
jgi:tRNA(Arg) A34 adenosine deaminase TadA